MIVDLRTYQYRPAGFQQFLRMYRERGFAITSRHLGQTLGIMTSHSGRANRTLQMFAYTDFDYRDACRGQLRADPEWLAFIGEAAVEIVSQDNQIVEPIAELAFPAARSRIAAEGRPHALIELCRLECEGGMAQRVIDDLAQYWARAELGGRVPAFAFRPITGTQDELLLMFEFANDADCQSGRGGLFALVRERGLAGLRSVRAERWLVERQSPLLTEDHHA